MTAPFGPDPVRLPQSAGLDPRPPVLASAARTLAEFVAPAVHADVRPAPVSAWAAPGEPVPFAAAAGQRYQPIGPGAAWGPPWGTTWFRVDCDAAGFDGDAQVELVVDLGFSGAQAGFQAEGLAYDAEGRVLKGVAPRNRWVPLRPGERVVVLIEAASNPDVAGDFSARPTPLGDPETAGRDPLYRFGGAVVARRVEGVWELEQDLHLLIGLAEVLPAGDRRTQVLGALGAAIAVLDPADVPGTAAAARAALAPALAVAAGEPVHRAIAVGHAHIDSAWLWPTRETVRKCARTFANVLHLMDVDDSVVFACSSAQQYAWIEEHHPALFARIRERVAEGRWVPVGGMWVESDTNMPPGESLVRQFLEGKRAFREWFGVDTAEVWLPDSFGYSAALPQIARGVGARFLLTQKASWNDTNPMPHHTFAWEGLDGSRILTHFPPVDTYNSDLSPGDLDHAARTFCDAGDAALSLVPYGWGDGGGGPTREMLAALRRSGDVQGLPRTVSGTPQAFFEQVEREVPEPPVWSGEIYLELHRGTYTSQARTKAGNRQSEALLHEAELWCATAAVRRGAPYPAEELRALWRTVLLLQFHDILPGSSIAWVHREAEADHARVHERLEALIAQALEVLTGPGERALAADATPRGGAIGPVVVPAAVRVHRRDGEHVRLRSDALEVLVRDGRGIASVVDRATGREVVPRGMRFGEPQAFRDLPNRWDAWDLDASYRDLPLPAVPMVVVEIGEDAVHLAGEIGGSSITQVVRLTGSALQIETEVDWQERRTVLKLAFPVDVVAPRVQSETQFGHVERATHANTSWEQARYEFPAHRWVRVGDAGWGVAVVNDRVYGHDALAGRGPDGGRITTVRQTLLRGATFPDPHADLGRHRFVTRVVPGDVGAAVEAGHALQLPPRSLRGGQDVAALVTVDGAVLDTVKLADDGSGDVIARLHEATGARVEAVVRVGFACSAAVRTDLLERPEGDPLDPAGLRLRLDPFRIATLRLAPA